MVLGPLDHSFSSHPPSYDQCCKIKTTLTINQLSSKINYTNLTIKIKLSITVLLLLCTSTGEREQCGYIYRASIFFFMVVPLLSPELLSVLAFWPPLFLLLHAVSCLEDGRRVISQLGTQDFDDCTYRQLANSRQLYLHSPDRRALCVVGLVHAAAYARTWNSRNVVLHLHVGALAC